MMPKEMWTYLLLGKNNNSSATAKLKRLINGFISSLFNSNWVLTCLREDPPPPSPPPRLKEIYSIALCCNLTSLTVISEPCRRKSANGLVGTTRKKKKTRVEDLYNANSGK